MKSTMNRCAIGAPAVYTQFKTIDDIINTMYKEYPDDYDDYWYIIKLYGSTLSRFASEIGELCEYDNPAHFVDTDLYEFAYNDILDEYVVTNLSKQARYEKENNLIDTLLDCDSEDIE